MAKITLKYCFGSITGLEFRDDIVKKEADLLAEGCRAEGEEERWALSPSAE